MDNDDDCNVCNINPPTYKLLDKVVESPVNIKDVESTLIVDILADPSIFTFPPIFTSPPINYYLM